MSWTAEELAQKLKDNPALKVAGQLYDYASHMATDANTPGPAKYHNRRTEYNGRIYDTKGEVVKAQELDMRVKAGEIDFWLYHVRFPLPGHVSYECDFMTFKFIRFAQQFGISQAWDIEVIECKMWRKATKKHKAGFFFTPESKLKTKLFRETYPNIKLTICKGD